MKLLSLALIIILSACGDSSTGLREPKLPYGACTLAEFYIYDSFYNLQIGPGFRGELRYDIQSSGEFTVTTDSLKVEVSQDDASVYTTMVPKGVYRGSIGLMPDGKAAWSFYSDTSYSDPSYLDWWMSFSTWEIVGRTYTLALSDSFGLRNEYYWEYRSKIQC